MQVPVTFNPKAASMQWDGESFIQMKDFIEQRAIDARVSRDGETLVVTSQVGEVRNVSVLRGQYVVTFMGSVTVMNERQLSLVMSG